MNLEPLSIVVLIEDEAPHLAECLDALTSQLAPGDEVLVMDLAPHGKTRRDVQSVVARHADAVGLHTVEHAMRAGAAKNLALRLTRHDAIVFLAAHAVPTEAWLDTMRAHLSKADVVYGASRHAPASQNLATVARGLRHAWHEARRDGLPEAHASDVNAAYRRLVFERLAFDEDCDVDEDQALAREARFEGFRLRHAPDALVHVKDVSSFGLEWRRHLQAGASRARHRGLLGTPTARLAWAILVGILGALGTFLLSPTLIASSFAVFFAPTLRRLSRPLRRRYRAASLVGATMASPLFDFAFVLAYLRRRMAH